MSWKYLYSALDEFPHLFPHQREPNGTRCWGESLHVAGLTWVPCCSQELQAQSTGPVAASLEGKPIINSTFFAVSPFIAEQGLRRKVLFLGAEQNSSTLLWNAVRRIAERLKMSRPQRLEIRIWIVRSFQQFRKKNPKSFWFYFNCYLLGLKFKQSDKS